jgi:glycerophosphoryl diester phosphodiesterase
VRLPPPPWIVGHRGAAGEAIENTPASVALAVAQGADLVEVDVQLTADGSLVAFHDWSLERLAGSPKVVESCMWEELAAAPLTAFGSQSTARVVRIGEILAVVPEGVPLVLEVKRRRADLGALLEALASVVASREALLLSSFDWDLLADARARWPEARIAPLGSGGARSLAAAGERLGAWSLHCPSKTALSLLESVAASRNPPRVLVYTVNDAARARDLFARGVAGVFTDFPGRLRSELAGGE